MAADDAVGRVGDGKVELRAEMVVQRGFRRQAALEALRPGLEGAASAAIGAADDRQAVGAVRVEPRHARLLALEDIVEPGAEPVLHALLAVQALGAGEALGIGGKRPVAAIGLERDLGRVIALQQRIALEFALDKVLQLQMRKLQELDRLQQLRRHHQGLALAQLHARHHRHAPATFPLPARQFGTLLALTESLALSERRVKALPQQ